MEVYLKVTFILISLLKLSECESVLGSIDSITIEIDLDSETNKKSEFPNTISTSNFDETTVYFENATPKTKEMIIKLNTDDFRTSFTREKDLEHELENSTVNEGVDLNVVEKQNNSISTVEDFYKTEERKEGVDAEAIIKFENTEQKPISSEYIRRHNRTKLHSRILKRLSKKERKVPIHTSETFYGQETKWTQDPYSTNDHENKVSVSVDYAPLDTKVHNLLHRYKTTAAAAILDDTELNENESKIIKESRYIHRHKEITPLPKTISYFYDQYPTKTTTVLPHLFVDSGDSLRGSTDFSTRSTILLDLLVTSDHINSKNENTIMDSHNDRKEKELPTVTAKNQNDETTINTHVEKETIREWMPLSFVKDAPAEIVNVTHIEKYEMKETETVVPITWRPQYEITSKVTTQVSSNNYTFEDKISYKSETSSGINQTRTSSLTEKNLKSVKDNDILLKTTIKPSNVHKTKCKYAKNVGDFDLNKFQGVLQTVYYTMQDKIPCFNIFVIKLSKEEKQQYREIYGDFGGKINWSRCDFEIKSETKLQRKHFLQNSGFADGVFENKIIVDESVDADVDAKSTLFEDTPDQWTIVNNLVLLRDCKTGRILLFKKNPRSRVSHRELKEALFAAGEGFNGRLSCRHKGRDPSDF